MRVGRGVAMAFLAAFALTAFAPAPFPRTKRGDEENINLQKFQGEWRSLGLKGINSNGDTHEINWGVTSIKVEGELWTFMFGQTENAKYVLVIDGTRKPATIDFYAGTTRTKEARPYMVGLIKRQGTRVTILYYSTTPEQRAKSFENPPANWWLLTLEKIG